VARERAANAAPVGARARGTLIELGTVRVGLVHTAGDEPPTRRNIMLFTIAILLCVLWALGLVTSYTLGGFIHILLVVAIVVVLIRVIQGRSVG
jgi:hypothetical protein